MNQYDQIRHFADSWGLVMMGVLFLVFVGWNFRKGSRERLDAAANSIFLPENPVSDPLGPNQLGDHEHGA